MPHIFLDEDLYNIETQSISDIIEQSLGRFSNFLIGKEIKLAKGRKFRKVINVEVLDYIDLNNYMLELTFENEEEHRFITGFDDIKIKID